MQKHDEWFGCYHNDGWKGLIFQEAKEHPSKFSRGLIVKIVEHIISSSLRGCALFHQENLGR